MPASLGVAIEDGTDRDPIENALYASAPAGRERVGEGHRARVTVVVKCIRTVLVQRGRVCAAAPWIMILKAIDNSGKSGRGSDTNSSVKIDRSYVEHQAATRQRGQGQRR